MKKLLLIAVLLLPRMLLAQGAYATFSVQTATGAAIAGASVAICTAKPTLATPCGTTTLQATFVDITLTTACTLNPTTLGPTSGIGCTNPGLSDGHGVVRIFAATGTYYSQTYGQGIVPVDVEVLYIPGTGANLASPPPIGNVTANTINSTVETVGPASPAGISALEFNGPDPFGLCNNQSFDQLTDVLDPATGLSQLAWDPNCVVNQRVFTTAFQPVPYVEGNIWAYDTGVALPIVAQNVTVNPLSGAFTGTYPGVFTNTQMNQTVTSAINGLNFTTEFTYAEGSNYATTGAGFGVKVPSGSTVHEVDGVLGIVSNFSGGTTNPVGFRAQCTNRANSGKCWAGDFVSEDVSGLTGPLTLYGLEMDFDPQNANGNYGFLSGVDVILNPGISGTYSAPAFQCQAATGSSWAQCIASSPGQAAVFASVGAACPSGNCGSQAINFNGSGAGAGTAGISGSQQGDFVIAPNSGRSVQVNAPVVAGGTAAALTGTGACATITTQTGGSWAGSAKCTGTTGVSTLTITPGFTAPNGFVCNVQDETTRANVFQQTSHTTAACILTVTSVTQNDVFVFSAIAF